MSRLLRNLWIDRSVPPALIVGLLTYSASSFRVAAPVFIALLFIFSELQSIREAVEKRK